VIVLGQSPQWEFILKSKWWLGELRFMVMIFFCIPGNVVTFGAQKPCPSFITHHLLQVFFS
jgi:hypothetical protein